MQGYQKFDDFINNNPVVVERNCHVSQQGNAPMWHEQLEIRLFYTEGTQLVIGNQVYLTEVDSVYIVNSCVPHSSQDENYNCYDRIYINIAQVISANPNCSTKVLEALNTGELLFRTHVKNNAVLNQRIRDLVDSYAGGEDTRLQTMGYMYLLLDELVQHESMVAEPNINQKHVMELSNKLSPAIALINDHFTQPLPISTLANACNLSEKYFCVLFKQRTGFSCVAYINQLRIEKAKILLLTTDKNITAIAEECGFSATGYFNRLFKNYVGCVPSNFRKRKRL